MCSFPCGSFSRDVQFPPLIHLRSGNQAQPSISHRNSTSAISGAERAVLGIWVQIHAPHTVHREHPQHCCGSLVLFLPCTGCMTCIMVLPGREELHFMHTGYVGSEFSSHPSKVNSCYSDQATGAVFMHREVKAELDARFACNGRGVSEPRLNIKAMLQMGFSSCHLCNCLFLELQRPWGNQECFPDCAGC